jgi:hypothetical protein
MAVRWLVGFGVVAGLLAVLSTVLSSRLSCWEEDGSWRR